MTIHERRPAGRSRGRLASGLLAATLIASLGATPVAAANVDFGSVAVGESASQGTSVPLTYALSDLPADTVVYGGGNSAIDLVLGSLGLVAPVTAGQLLNAIGDVTATYHVGFASSSGSEFSVDSGDCLTGSIACSVEVTFHPTGEGLRTATISAHLQDVQTSGGGSFSSLISLLAPFVATSVESQLSVEVSGVGTEGTTGGVILRVAVEPDPVPCILVDVTSLDFGTLPFSTEGGDSTGAQSFSVSTCSTGDESVYAAGTDATGDGEPAGAWTLADAQLCDGTPNLYGLGLTGTVGTQDPQLIDVITDQRAFVDLQPGDAAATDITYHMPCQGSSGAGQTMTSQVTFTAVIQ